MEYSSLLIVYASGEKLILTPEIVLNRTLKAIYDEFTQEDGVILVELDKTLSRKSSLIALNRQHIALMVLETEESEGKQ